MSNFGGLFVQEVSFYTPVLVVILVSSLKSV